MKKETISLGKFTSIDQYHGTFPAGTQKLLDRMRSTIRKALPAAEEIISYNIPTFKQGKNIVHYAGYEKHIGFYPGASPLVAFRKELAPYKTSKGGIQFPLDKPLPVSLIAKISKYRLDELKKKALLK